MSSVPIGHFPTANWPQPVEVPEVQDLDEVVGTATHRNSSHPVGILVSMHPYTSASNLVFFLDNIF